MANVCYLDVTTGMAYVANLGNSRALYCRYSSDLKSYLIVPLSKDHKISDPLEKARIEQSNFCVLPKE